MLFIFECIRGITDFKGGCIELIPEEASVQISDPPQFIFGEWRVQLGPYSLKILDFIVHYRM